jgi:serine/threonine-protein kinase
MSEEIPWGPGGLKPGARLAGYLLEEQVGRGGMAVVYRAYDDRLDRRVALKVLAPDLARDEAFRRRFIQESRAAAAVDHPHIIPVFDAGETDGVLYLAMRYVPGGDVRMLLDRAAPLPIARACGLIAQVASALDAAHARGLVHRDVKPTNMLLDLSPASSRPDHVYLSDFGLAKPAAATSGVTMTGQFLGTVDYVAPEQIQGQPVDGRADLYSLACASFEMLCGAPPFRREHSMAVLSAQLTDPPPSLVARRPELPAAVDAVMARALAKAPADRYGRCLEFAEALLAACGIGTGGPGVGGLPGPGVPQPGVPQPAMPPPGTPQPAMPQIPAPHPPTEVAAPVAAAGPAAGPGAAGGPGAAAATPGAAPGQGPSPGAARGAPGVPSPRQPGAHEAARQPGLPAGTRQPGGYEGARQPGGYEAAVRLPGAPGAASPGGYAAGAGQQDEPETGPAAPGWWTDVSAPVPDRGGPAGPVGPPRLARPARRRRGRFVLLGAVLVLAAGAAVAYGLLNGKIGHPQAAPTPTVTVRATHSASERPTPTLPPAPPGPAATVRAYFAAINNHDYARAWDLGGRNTGSAYPAFVNGFQSTAHDNVTILSVAGAVVTAQIAAHQTDGTVQTYQGTYQVSNGVITHFQVRRLS